MQIINKILGEGSYGKVKIIIVDDKEYAIKLFKKNKHQSNEYEIHKNLKHKNILNCIAGNKEFILCELMQQHDLFQYLEQGRKFSINSSNVILKKLIQGLEYMHNLGYVHRDLKLENILFDEDYEIKICDFGFAEHINNGLVSKNIGSDGYIAPELMGYGEIDASQLIPCDIFSLGIIYFMMIIGRPPIERADNSCKYWRLIKQNQWEEYWYNLENKLKINIPQIQKVLIEGMLNSNPQNRLKLSDIINLIEYINEDGYIIEMENIKMQLDRRRQ